MTETTLTPPPELVVPAPADRRRIAGDWMAAFLAAAGRHAGDEAGRLFTDESWWRDLLATQWDFRTSQGVESIRAALDDPSGSATFTAFALRNDLEPRFTPATDDAAASIEALFTFTTTIGEGRGVLRLVQHDGTWKAWTLLTALRDICGHEQRRGARRPTRVPASDPASLENWADWRERTSEFLDSSPDVLVIGSGHNGLVTAANLGFWGVKTLVIEKNARVGDNWRSRYRTLVLHDAIWADHLPGMSFPDSWPVYMPKDKVADWLELYASAMELNVWTGTELIDSSYDDATQRWTVRVRRPDGSERVLHPADVVIATGVHGEPRIPELPGADGYRGRIVHSSGYVGDELKPGQKAVVVGAGNSAHDAAQNLQKNGVQVTMIQRSSTYIVSQAANYQETIGKLYHEGGPATDDADLLNISFPYKLALERAVPQTRAMAELDREMLTALEAADYHLDMGTGGAGGLSKILNGPGGYYLDVGCAELITSGKIALTHAGIERLTETGVLFDDGTEVEADLIVLATGYKNMRETARRILGDEAADRCVPVWGLTEGGEVSGMWRTSGHPGLWFQGGPLFMARIYSHYLTLRLHALHLGLSPRA